MLHVFPVMSAEYIKPFAVYITVVWTNSIVSSKAVRLLEAYRPDVCQVLKERVTIYNYSLLSPNDILMALPSDRELASRLI